MSPALASESAAAVSDQIVTDAWNRIAQENRSSPPEETWTNLFAGLPRIASGNYRHHNPPLILSDVVFRLLAAGPSMGPPASVLPKLARKLLAVGYLHPSAPAGEEPPAPEDDAILAPRKGVIDAECQDADLSFARAVGAVEWERSSLLADVVARRLHFLQGAAEGWQAAALDWLTPLLEDMTAQCLLVNRLAAGPTESDAVSARLLPRLVALYAQHWKAESGARHTWRPGPLAACCALGLLLRQPAEALWYARLQEELTSWPGWKDEDVWPVRHPGTDLNDLRYRLTRSVVHQLQLPDSKLWGPERMKPFVGPDSEALWPPLGCFVWPRARER